jgi:hypothetical protein
MRVVPKLYREIDALVFASPKEYENWIWANYPEFQIGSCLADPLNKGVELMGYTSVKQDVWVLSEEKAHILNV